MSEPNSRRRWLQAGALAWLGAPTTSVRSSAAPRSVPAHQPWQRQLGAQDEAYGAPALGQRHVVRQASPNAPGFQIWHTPLQELHGTITPSGLHFAVHHSGIPDIAPERHELVLHGMVEKPLTWSVADLLRYPMVSRMAFIECAGNSATQALSPWAKDLTAGDLHGQVSCAEWTGIPLALLLREAHVKPKASWVVAEGADAGGHQRSIPLQKLYDDALLVLYQNGERLRPSQGYPLRLLLPGWEGNAQVKWLHRLEVTDAPIHAKDEAGLYTQVLANGQIERMAFTMEVKSVITSPSGMQTLGQHGFREISGLAWSGRGRIAKVEVTVDGGDTWREASIIGPVLPKALTRFSVPWQWTGQKATVMSRAHDEHGHVQPTRRAWKSRYAAHSFNHYNAVQAWHIDRQGKVSNAYVS